MVRDDEYFFVDCDDCVWESKIFETEEGVRKAMMVHEHTSVDDEYNVYRIGKYRKGEFVFADKIYWIECGGCSVHEDDPERLRWDDLPDGFEGHENGYTDDWKEAWDARNHHVSQNRENDKKLQEVYNGHHELHRSCEVCSEEVAEVGEGVEWRRDDE
jgi:hypothetical protein